MAYVKTLEDRIRENTKIQLTDLFGKGRIRKQMWEYDTMKNNKNREIERLQIIAASQSKAVNAMVIRTEQLEKENAMLRGYIAESDKVKRDILKRLSIAEAKVAKLKEHTDEMEEVS